jgi:acylphosphatase
MASFFITPATETLRSKKHKTIILMQKRVHLIVSGAVQGVGYRMFIERKAKELTLDGWVRNRIDGTVEIDAQGPEKAIDELLHQAKRGPSRSMVTSIRQEEREPDGSLDHFSVIM